MTPTADANPGNSSSCPHCGTENDFFYTYCQRCLKTLPSNRGSRSRR